MDIKIDLKTAADYILVNKQHAYDDALDCYYSSRRGLKLVNMIESLSDEVCVIAKNELAKPNEYVPLIAFSQKSAYDVENWLVLNYAQFKNAFSSVFKHMHFNETEQLTAYKDFIKHLDYIAELDGCFNLALDLIEIQGSQLAPVYQALQIDLDDFYNSYYLYAADLDAASFANELIDYFINKLD